MRVLWCDETLGGSVKGMLPVQSEVMFFGQDEWMGYILEINIIPVHLQFPPGVPVM